MTDAAPLLLLPAVDVAGGRAVRLVRAVAGSAADHGDPYAVALGWQEAGAPWVHLVDIDAAFGRGANRERLTSIVQRLDVPVQVSGGVRDEASLVAALATGCARVNVATAALLDLDWVAGAIGRYGDRVAVGLDVRGSRLVSRGSDEDAGDLSEVLAAVDAMGCARYVVTDVLRDGALSGPNLDLLARVCRSTDRPVIASGGVGSVADIATLRRLVPAGIEGAIVGQALYTGAVGLADALAAAASPLPATER